MSTRKPATSAAKTDTNTPADENAARPQNDSPIAATPADSEESENLEAASTNSANRATTPLSTTTTTVDSEEISIIGEGTAGRERSSPEITVSEAAAPVTPKTPAPTPTPTSTPTTTHTEGKSVRITRHSSPLLLLSSPTTTTTTSGSSSARRDASDGDAEEPTSSSTNINNSTSQSLRKSSVERSLAPIIRGRKSIKDLKEAKEATKSADVTDESAVAVEVGESSSSAELDEKNDQPKDTQKDKDKEKDKEKEKEKEKEPVTTPTTTCNRVTRKSLAQEQVNNTRITRNRRKSSTIGIGGTAAAEQHQQQQQQLPPARGRGRKKTAPAAAAIPIEVAVKRKRSEDDVEVAAKYAKIEIKPPPLDDEPADEDGGEEASSSKSSTVAIKQEPQDSDTSSPAATPTPTPTTASCRRGRGRPITKQQTPTASLSATTATTTTTRATRLNKAGSPGVVVAAEPAAPPKRRRVGSTTRKTASTSSLTTTGSHGAGDEDSKDSMASSMDDLLLAAADIKQEKLLPDFDEASLLAVSLKAATDEVEPSRVPPTSTSIAAGSSNGHACHEPLTVDTESSDSKAMAAKIEDTAVCVAAQQPQAKVSAESCSESSSVNETAGKAPSLSPEMISEGVSAISVKQFYKKPEFLANNLGIEKDPELGEIVQIVSNNEVLEGEGETEHAQTDIEIAVETKKTADSDETKEEAKIAAKKELVNSKEQTIDDDYSNTSMKAGELQLQESGDIVEPSEESILAINGEGEGDGDSKLPSPPLPSSTTAAESQVEEEATVAYDDIDHEIMQELANEGVVDASGNAMSNSDELQVEEEEEEVEDVAPIEDEMESIKAVEEDDGLDMDGLQEGLNECDTVKEADDVDAEEEHASDGDLAMDVDSFPTEAQGEAESEAVEPEIEMESATDQENLQLADQHDNNDFPEENKENVSTSTGSHDTLDIQLTMKDDEDEEKPLAVVAAEQKPKRGADLDIKSHLSLKPDVVVDTVKGEHEEEEEKPLATVCAEQKLNGKEVKVNEVDDEQRKEKELHLQNLGLLTHQAAELIRQEYIQEANSRQAQQQNQQQQHSGKRHGSKGSGGGSATHVESSGTLKTVIKLNRSSNGGAGGHSGVPTGTVIHGSGAAHGAASSSASSIGSAAATRKASAGTGTGVSSGSAHGVRRQSLKMTFQKGRARGHGAADRSNDQHGAHAEDSYYTIQNENEGATKSNGSTGTRKTTNRFSSTNNHNNNNNHTTIATHLSSNSNASRSQLDSSHSEGQAEHGFYQMVVKKDEKEKILIPEKASSFKFHPGRLCEDQCYYCSGKFGLYDTPCHVGQIKSVERQQKILASEYEEKLTVDNCLCDACFRHVDRRANAPSYKKRLSAPGHLETGGGVGGGVPVSGVPADKHYSGDSVDNEFGQVPPGGGGSSQQQQQQRACAIKDCGDSAGHSLRRKCIRKSVKKFLLNFEIPAGTSNVWLCDAHYNTVIQSSGCVLCKRRLGKNHMYHITSDTDRLEKALSEMGIPVQLGVGTAVCKLCRYFANLLMKPPDSTKSIKAEFVKNYRLRLLKVHNLQDGSNEASEADDEELLNAAVTPAGASQATTLAASDDPEMAMVVDYDGPTDSNSSSSSTTTTGNNACSAIKQMSKLEAILQQSLVDGDGSTRIASGASSAAASASSNANSKSGSDISNVLRGNPNISMRELFHGEEELGVQFKVPFGCSSSQRTPEGWTRVQTFLQYDEPTRRLWEELQKPYGNQSSFLRHLILLEKYYRNGDLVLAPHASSNASVYTETVRQRLNSFDHGHCGGLSTTIGGGKRSTANAAAASATTSGGGGPAVSVTTLAPTEKVNPNPAEPVIPLVELNDDDDGDQPPHHLTPEPIDVDAPSSSLERLSNASVDKLTKQLSSNAVTIIARPKDKQQQQHHQQSAASAAATSSPPPSITNVQSLKDAPPLVPTGSGANSRSILKTNLLGMNKSVEIVPLPSSVTATTTTASSSAAPPPPILIQASNNNNSSSKPPPAASLEKPHKILDVANKLLNSQNEAQQHSASLLTMPPKLKPALSTSSLPLAGGGGSVLGIKPQLLSSPPELISLQRRRAGAAVAAASGGVGSGPNIAGVAAMAAAASSLLGNMSNKRLQLPRAGGGGSGAGGNTRPSGPPPNVVILPETLTPQERHESKSWKPTLIPLEDQHKVPNKSHALYQTADGRRLPALVQVQSGGKPYLISIFDYNRMCILRREKLLRDQMLKANAKPKVGQTQQQQSSNVAGSAAELLNFAKMTQQQHQTARQQMQQMQQKLQQKQQHHHQHQQQQQQQMPTLQPGGGGGSANSNLRLARLAPKPMPPLTNPTQNVNAAAAAAAVANFPPLLANALVNSNNNNPLDSNSSWLWKNFPDANQYLLNGNGGGSSGPAGGGGGCKMPHLTSKSSTATTGSSSSSNSGSNLKMGNSSSYTLKQQQHQQKLIENAIMSKIPKSLTVIPQQIGNEAAASGPSVTATKD
ncbi:platelet binding protein GspB isoform X2 [Drosophila tropicalis]|uniref:platelet binding protein GspB isoform X2 n=1 Tax=Drosophila tropicalis TaxID=46794 RepID=UPI0035AC17C2